MKRRDRKKLEALVRIKELNEVLLRDTGVAYENLKQRVALYTPTDSVDWDLAFSAKTAARAFMSQVDGLSFSMRQAVIEFSSELGVELTDKERLKLQERRMTAEGKVVDAFLSPAESFKVAFRYYPSLFGISCQLDLNSSYWTAFRTLVEARNSLTHPETLEDLLGKDIFFTIHPVSLWFHSRVMELLDSCVKTIEGTDIKLAKVDFSLPPLKFSGGHPVIFAEEHYEKIRSVSSRTLKYVQEGLEVLMKDVSRAFDLVLAPDNLLGEDAQFGLRNLVRTFYSGVEGVLGIAKFFIMASAKRGEFSLSEEDLKILEEVEFSTDHGGSLVKVLGIWSREFGSNEQVRIGGKQWQDFCATQKLRDRLTHPRSSRDLFMGLNVVETIMGAQDWFLKVVDLMHIGDHWAGKARDIGV